MIAVVNLEFSLSPLLHLLILLLLFGLSLLEPSQPLINLKQGLPFPRIRIVDVLLPGDEGVLVDDIELVQRDEPPEQQTFREVSREAEHLEAVDGDELQLGLVGEEVLKHRLVLLDQLLLALRAVPELLADVAHHGGDESRDETGLSVILSRD